MGAINKGFGVTDKRLKELYTLVTKEVNLDEVDSYAKLVYKLEKQVNKKEELWLCISILEYIRTNIIR